MVKRQTIYTLASIYVGTVIGAGFASGQEIFQFFGKYGYKGIIGILITTVLFSLLGASILNIVYIKKIKSFEQFTAIYFNKNTCKTINIILMLLLFIGYVVMLSGSGAVVYEHFKLKYIWGIIIMNVTTFIVFIFGIKGIAKANNIIVPFLIFVILYVSINVIIKNKMLFSNFYTYPLQNINLVNYKNGLKVLTIHLLNKSSWLISSLLYVAFNSIGTIVVMSSVGPLIKNKKEAILGGILGGTILGILAMAILISLLVFNTNIIGIEVPMIAISNNLNVVWKQIYTITLLLAMFTTAIANGYGCIEVLYSLTKINLKLSSIIVCSLSIPLATLGFKRLVTIFYPLLGYIGLIFILTILFKKEKSIKDFNNIW